MDNKERILHAARELFGTLGFADTTYKRIAQHLGIAEGLIAHYFGNKDNLFDAVQTRILQDLSERMAEGEFYAHHGSPCSSTRPRPSCAPHKTRKAAAVHSCAVLRFFPSSTKARTNA
ncbi:MAG: helix-turn-helix transcriptional regulator, partial [Desulfomicrobiaceae bacterium]|nr:helix-turn-helix transcriptional regulator [Desulfomicrobiaceae bacterium]